MGKNTLGPWRVGDAFTIFADNPRRIIAEASHDYQGLRRGDEENKANARLIAAAPDLLAALQDMVSLWERVHEKDGPVLLGTMRLKNARAAIAKATKK